MRSHTRSRASRFCFSHSHVSPFLSALALLGYTAQASADGSSQLGVTQALQNTTSVYIDIVAPSVERITWSGTGSVTVYHPDGTLLGSFPSGSSITPSVAGAHRLALSSNQTTAAAWDFGVANAVDGGGRVFSYGWKFNTGSYASNYASNGSVYAVVPSGPGATSVIEMKMNGLSGFVYELSANRIGVTGGNGMSRPMSGNSTNPEFRIYLRPPTLATYASTTPSLNNFAFRGGSATNVFGAPMSCNQVVPGQAGGSFSFETDTVGTYNVQCDLDGDGIYSRLGGSDLLLVGGTVAGQNTVPWDGKNSSGALVPVGTYNCRMEVHGGEFHYVGQDIETSYQGFRLFEVKSDLSRQGLTMFWNDEVVQSAEVTMPNGALGRVSSGESGVASGAYGDPAVANVNARSWGGFSATSKGNNNLLDTYVWLSENASALVSVMAVDGTTDTDGDGLSDFSESCTYGTSPTNPDTDGDGTPDGAQYGGGGVTGGQSGGLESNGRLSTALARREITRSGVLMSPINKSLRALGCTEERCSEETLPLETLALLELAPKQGPRGSIAKPASPVDLPSYTNAVAAGGYDYVNAKGERIGTILIVETKGELYEHSKAICDRAHGAWITGINAAAVRGAPIVGATSSHPAARTRDGSLSFIVYGKTPQESQAHYEVASRWLLSDYPAPHKEQQVLEVQVWASNPGDERELAHAILTSLEAKGELSFAPEVTAPSAYAAHAATLGGEVDLTLRSETNKNVEVVATLRREDDSFEVVPMRTLVVNQTTQLKTKLPMFLDASVDFLVEGKVVDKVWLSDGTWVPFDAGMFGGRDGISSFAFTQCAQTDASFDAGMRALGVRPAVRFSGCGHTVGKTGRAAGVARHFANPIDLRAQSGLVFHLKSNTPVRTCIESTSLHAFACKDLPAQDAWVKLAWQDFEGSDTTPEGGLTILHTVALNYGGDADIEVSGLSAAVWDQAEDAAGCTTGARPTNRGTDVFAGLLALLAGVMGKRRTRP